jgi:rRNA processing protein Krr1/Pno1
MRTAQEVIQAVGTSAPSEQNMRIANEAYQMEAQAQQDYTRKAAEGQGSWEWFA